jgi:hypothetical protein
MRESDEEHAVNSEDERYGKNEHGGIQSMGENRGI